MLAAITKSAQMPFSAWLPAAIAAPTPVRALVHSSTLVTAGVYLLIRFNPLLLEYGVGKVLVLVGGLTTLIARVSANFETDLKKVVALSTLSQLGIIVRTLSLGFGKLAFFHLLTHAIFKALLFLCRGKVIHESLETQDARAMGGLLVRLPFTRMCINLSNLALCGFPFLAGFYSKDLLVERRLILDQGRARVWLIGVNVGLSAAYSVRLRFVRIVNFTNLPALRGRREDDVFIKISKFGLRRMAILGGRRLSWLIFPEAPAIILPAEFKLLALYSTLLGGFVGLVVRLSNALGKKLRRGGQIYVRILQMWFLPWLSGGALGRRGGRTGKIVKRIDLGWWEAVGGQGVYSVLLKGSFTVNVWQNRTVKMFIIVFIGGVFFTLFGFLRSSDECDIEAIKEVYP